MPTTIYSVESRETLFDGIGDSEGSRMGADCRYKGDGREKSLELARNYSDDGAVEVCEGGISRDVYQWNAVEYSDDGDVIGCEVKIFDPLDKFEQIKDFAKCARLHDRDLISYIVGERELIGEFNRGGRACGLYRYTDTAFGDFTAYEDEGGLWLPETFSDYAIMAPDELMLMMNEGVTFWQDWQTDDPEARLLYKIFQNY